MSRAREVVHLKFFLKMVHGTKTVEKQCFAQMLTKSVCYVRRREIVHFVIKNHSSPFSSHFTPKTEKKHFSSSSSYFPSEQNLVLFETFLIQLTRGIISRNAFCFSTNDSKKSTFVFSWRKRNAIRAGRDSQKILKRPSIDQIYHFPSPHVCYCNNNNNSSVYIFCWVKSFRSKRRRSQKFLDAWVEAKKILMPWNGNLVSGSMNLIIMLVELVPEWLKIFLPQMVYLSIPLAYIHLSICMERQRKKE